MKKWIIILLIAAAGAGVAYKQLPGWKTNADSAGVETRPKEAVAEVRDIQFSVPAAGEISPAEQVSVKPEINGKIEALPVDIGDDVKKGTLLFKLDDKELQNERASTETEVARARLQLEQAQRNFARAEELFSENLIAKELYENTRTEFELAKNSLEKSQRNLALIEERLRKTAVHAPFDCTILTRPVSVGQAVSGSGGFNSGTEVLTIADLNNLIINAHINQADITRLRQDQEVDVAVEAVPGLSVVGQVERIAPQATIRNNIKGFAVRILLKDVDKRIRPGMTANIKIPVASAEEVVAIPLAAVFTERDPQTYKSQRYVYVKTGPNRYEKRAVRVGVADFFYAEIQSGLEPGETVALEPPSQGAAQGGKMVLNQRNGGSKAVDGATTKGGKAPAPSTRPGSSGTNPQGSRGSGSRT